MTFQSQMGSVSGMTPFDGEITCVNGASAIGICDVMMFDFQFSVATNYDLGDPLSVFTKLLVPDNTATTTGGRPRVALYPLCVVTRDSLGNTAANTAVAASTECRAKMFGVVLANCIRASGDITRGDGLWSTGTSRNLTGSATAPAITLKYSAIALQTKVAPTTKTPTDVFFNGWTGWNSESGT